MATGGITRLGSPVALGRPGVPLSTAGGRSPRWDYTLETRVSQPFRGISRSTPHRALGSLAVPRHLRTPRPHAIPHSHRALRLVTSKKGSDCQGCPPLDMYVLSLMSQSLGFTQGKGGKLHSSCHPRWMDNPSMEVYTQYITKMLSGASTRWARRSARSETRHPTKTS